MTEKIRKISSYTKFKGQDSEKYLSSVQEFDENGNTIYHREYDEEKNLISLIEISYNEQQLPISEINESFEEGFSEKKFMKYDHKGNLSEKKIEYDGGAFSILKYIYDLNTVEIITFDEEDEQEERSVIKYDDKKRIVLREEYDDRNKLTEKIVNAYDDKTGNIIQKEEYESKDKLVKIHYYYYLETGLLQGVKTENRKGKTIDWVKVEYDEKKRPTIQKSMSGAIIKLEYDDENSCVKESFIDGSGAVVSEKTTYKNNQGNVLKEDSLEKEMFYEYEWY